MMTKKFLHSDHFCFLVSGSVITSQTKPNSPF